jgi:hypothetical protein
MKRCPMAIGQDLKTTTEVLVAHTNNALTIAGWVDQQSRVPTSRVLRNRFSPFDIDGHRSK